jgi:hypothetical protein
LLKWPRAAAVSAVEVHLQAGDLRPGGADREPGRGRRRLAGDERRGRTVARVALDADQALDRQRGADRARGRRRDGLLRTLGRGSLRGLLAHRASLPDAPETVNPAAR